TGNTEALNMVTRTLEAMARSGMYDQVSGGFHRYAVDGRWQVPHFEKMLYDNAQLPRVYVHAWQVTGEPLFRAIAEETLDFVLREMSDPAGGFIASLDADSEGEEGKFYLWSAQELQELLGDMTDRFRAAYPFTERGNFAGRNILTLSASFEERQSLAEARRRLLAARHERVPPARDDQVLTSWNGLMLAAFAEASRILDRADYRQAAEHCADFLLSHMRRPDGWLWHVWQNGRARFIGYLDDATHLIEGLLELYMTTFHPPLFTAVRELAEMVLAHFRATVGFFDTSNDHEALPVRPRQWQDNALPSGNSMAAFVLLRLAGLALEPRYEKLARQSLGAMQPFLVRYPLSFGQWLVALDYALAPRREVAIVGAPDAADTRALLAAATAGYRPHQVVAAGHPDAAPLVPLLAGRTLREGKATAYVCQGGVCQAPTTNPADLI
ncbi:MAG: thioredoxin domain-containing protein, partial [Anaerolineae bacterium]